MIETTTFTSLTPGPNLVVLGAVHGDEHCGPLAIRRFIEDVQSNKISLTKGTVTVIPVCNPKAYQEKRRFIDRNLNRALYPKDTPEAYEDFIDPILCTVLDKADALLDLHSYQSQGGPFCFLGTSSQAEIDFALAIKAPYYIYGWSEAFGKSTDADPRLSMGTTEYTRSQGGVAVTLECGHHHNPDAADIGYDAIINALTHFEMIDAAEASQPAPTPRMIKMQTVFFKEKAGQFVKPWQHCDAVAADEPIAVYDDGQQILAPTDGFLVLPKTSLDHPLGSEWVYFGVETDVPAAEGVS